MNRAIAFLVLSVGLVVASQESTRSMLRSRSALDRTSTSSPERQRQLSSDSPSKYVPYMSYLHLMFVLDANFENQCQYVSKYGYGCKGRGNTAAEITGASVLNGPKPTGLQVTLESGNTYNYPIFNVTLRNDTFPMEVVFFNHVESQADSYCATVGTNDDQPTKDDTDGFGWLLCGYFEEQCTMKNVPTTKNSTTIECQKGQARAQLVNYGKSSQKLTRFLYRYCQEGYGQECLYYDIGFE